MRMTLAFALLALAPLDSSAQPAAPPAAPPPPAFAASNVSEKGARDMAANCASCHGTSGRIVPGSATAGLAGRGKDELAQMMMQFKAGQKPATVMHQIAKGYSDAEIAALAEYFSRQRQREAP